MFESWRGIVGDIKPTHRPGSLEEFIRLLVKQGPASRRPARLAS